MMYYPVIRKGKAISDVAYVAVFQFRRTSGGLEVKYSDTKFLISPQVETDI